MPDCRVRSGVNSQLLSLVPGLSAFPTLVEGDVYGLLVFASLKQHVLSVAPLPGTRFAD